MARRSGSVHCLSSTEQPSGHSRNCAKPVCAGPAVQRPAREFADELRNLGKDASLTDRPLAEIAKYLQRRNSLVLIISCGYEDEKLKETLSVLRDYSIPVLVVTDDTDQKLTGLAYRSIPASISGNPVTDPVSVRTYIRFIPETVGLMLKNMIGLSSERG